MRRRVMVAGWAVASSCLAPAITPPVSVNAAHPSQLGPPCRAGQFVDRGAVRCNSLAQFSRLATGLPFTAADPRGVVAHLTHLQGDVMAVTRVADPPTGVATFPIGPPQSLITYFGSPTSSWTMIGPPRRSATFVRVIQYQLSYTGKPRLHRVMSHGRWTFTADILRQHMTIEVDSDGPEAVVGAIGKALVTTEAHLPVKPTAPERVYVSAPHVLHVGKPATFWVLVAPRWGVYPAAAFDFDFSLGGSWNRPVTETPDGSQACGGDNVAGQPTRRAGRWLFRWGDCPELGLILTPRSAGRHTLTIDGYRVPITAKGMLDLKHEKIAGGSGYRWHGTVLP